MNPAQPQVLTQLQFRAQSLAQAQSLEKLQVQNRYLKAVQIVTQTPSLYLVVIQKVSQARFLHLTQTPRLFLSQSQFRTQDAFQVQNLCLKVFQIVYLDHSQIHHVNLIPTHHLNPAQPHFLSL